MTNLTRHLFRLRLEELLALVFFVPMSILTLAYAGEEGFTPGNIERYFAVLVLVLLFVVVVRRNRYLQILRDLLPIACCVVIYLNLHDLIHFVNTRDKDDVLLKIDAWLFGVQPSLWLEHFVHPWIIDYTTICYSLFYFYGPLVMLALYFRHEYHTFRQFVVSGLLCFYVGYFVYILVPAIGPRYSLSAQYAKELIGSHYSYQLRHSIDVLQTTKRDCFPSLHNGFTLLTMLFAYKHLRGLFYFLLPFAFGLFLATIYLRYHYVIDQLAGFSLAIVCFWLGPRISDFWDRQMADVGQQ